MKKAGEILSAIFDEQFVKKAQTFENLFESWIEITAENDIASAAEHSRIKDLTKGVLLVEIDHPGWKQIIQTKQKKLLKEYQSRFPDMEITKISLVLGSSKPASENKETQELPQKEQTPSENSEYIDDETVASYFNDIKDDELREKLIKLGQTIAVREKCLT